MKYKIYLLILMFIFIISCKIGRDKSNDKIKIGFILSTMQQERYKKEKKYFIKRVEELGGEVLFDESYNTASIQYQKVENRQLTEQVQKQTE